MNYLTDILGGFLDIIREGAADVLHDLTGTAATANGDATVTGTNTLFLTELAIGDTIKIGSVTGEILSIASNTSLELTANANALVAATTFYKLAEASAAARPSATDTSWQKIADVEGFGYQPKIDAEEVIAPSESGGYHRKKKITKKSDLDLIFTVNDLTELIHELVLLASGAITDEFTPMSGDGMIRGWYRFRARKQEGGTVVTMLRVWAEMSAENLDLGNAVPKPKLTVAVLKNSLNKGSLTLAA